MHQIAWAAHFSINILLILLNLTSCTIMTCKCDIIKPMYQ
eukprot:UN03735